MNQLPENPLQRLKRERQDRANLRLQLQAQTANQMTWVLVLLNAGGLTALVTWMQTFDWESEVGTCDAVLTRFFPWAACVLLVGIFCAVCSYFIRYRSDGGQADTQRWMGLLHVGVAALLAAGLLVVVTVTSCNRLAVEAKRADQKAAAMDKAKSTLAVFGDERGLDHLRDRDDEARLRLQIAIAKSYLGEMRGMETQLAEATRIEVELSELRGRYGPNGHRLIDQQLQQLAIVKQELQGRLRNRSGISSKE